jgi:hypothetical protein
MYECEVFKCSAVRQVRQGGGGRGGVKSKSIAVYSICPS